MLRIDKRRDLWQSIATDLMPRHLDDITSDISVLEAPDTLRTIVGGGVTGRTRVVVQGRLLTRENATSAQTDDRPSKRRATTSC